MSLSKSDYELWFYVTIIIVAEGILLFSMGSWWRIPAIILFIGAGVTAKIGYDTRKVVIHGEQEYVDFTEP